MKDAEDSYDLIGGEQNFTHTEIAFRRPWNTCDGDDSVLGVSVTISFVLFSDLTNLTKVAFWGQSSAVCCSIFLRLSTSFSFSKTLSKNILNTGQIAFFNLDAKKAINIVFIICFSFLEKNT